MVIEGIILTFIESKKFKRNRLIKTAFKSRVIGVILIVLSVVLYAFSIYSF
ncbi:CLC_0170 family protein [Clostridium sp. 001]